MGLVVVAVAVHRKLQFHFVFFFNMCLVLLNVWSRELWLGIQVTMLWTLWYGMVCFNHTRVHTSHFTNHLNGFEMLSIVQLDITTFTLINHIRVSDSIWILFQQNFVPLNNSETLQFRDRDSRIIHAVIQWHSCYEILSLKLDFISGPTANKFQSHRKWKIIKTYQMWI